MKERSVPIIRWLAAATLVACGDAVAPVLREDTAWTVVPGQRVAGSGHVQQAAGLREFSFHAVRHPDGTAGGSYKVVLANGLFFEADVTCLAVAGNTGWVGGSVRATNAAAVIIGGRSTFYAVDNGEGGAAADIVSLAAFNMAAGAELDFCANRPLALPPLTVTDGNVQVR